MFHYSLKIIAKWGTKNAFAQAHYLLCTRFSQSKQQIAYKILLTWFCMVVDDIYSKYQYNTNFCKMKIIKIEGEKSYPYLLLRFLFLCISLCLSNCLFLLFIYGKEGVNACIYFIHIVNNYKLVTRVAYLIRVKYATVSRHKFIQLVDSRHTVK